jgi:hypothetical protein
MHISPKIPRNNDEAGSVDQSEPGVKDNSYKKWRWGSLVRCLPTMWETLGSIGPSLDKKINTSFS